MSIKKTIRFDSGKILRITETKEGFLKGDAIVTRTGVFTYVNNDGSLRKELRHPDNVFSLDSLSTLEMIPITDNHPSELVNSKNAKNLSIGTTGEDIKPDGKYLLSSVIITDQVAINAIDSGKRSLSLGYEVVLVKEDGEYNGERYDYKQTNIRYNHLALVTTARAGSEAKLKFDSNEIDYAIEINSEKQNNKPLQKEVNMDLVKIDCGDGLNYDAAPEVSVLVKNLTRKNTMTEQKLDNLEKKFDEMKKDNVKIGAERDVLKEKLNKAEKMDNSELINKKATEIILIRKVADSVLKDEEKKNLDTMKVPEIKKLCVVAKYPSIKEDATNEYISARFDLLVEDIDSGSLYNTDSQRLNAIPKFNGKNNDEFDPDIAQQKAFDEMKSLHLK